MCGTVARIPGETLRCVHHSGEYPSRLITHTAHISTTVPHTPDIGGFQILAYSIRQVKAAMAGGY